VFGIVLLIQDVICLLYPVEISVDARHVGPPRSHPSVDGSSLMWFLDERRRGNGIHGGWWGFGRKDDWRGSWPIGLRLGWRVDVRFGWRIVNMWRNINILKYSGPGIL